MIDLSTIEVYCKLAVAPDVSVSKDGMQVEYRVAAVFHDLLEDTDASEQEIVEIGGEDVLKAVKLVTKEKEYCMETYIAGIKTNSMA